MITGSVPSLRDRYVGALFAGSSNLLGGVDVMGSRVASGVYNGYEHYWSGNPPAPNTNIVCSSQFLLYLCSAISTL